MRGKVYSPAKYPAFSRITPAYAGKRPDTIAKLKKAGDHPRLCGEKRGSKPPKPCTRGSPPPMRGKEIRRQLPLSRGRITPAYAGKSTSMNAFCHNIRDHPRLCGEKLLLCEHCGKPIGSPPPMRGKVCGCPCRVVPYRITPAYAGKRYRFFAQVLPHWDHPRLCGEKSDCLSDFGTVQGSPPPMRGKAKDDVDPPERIRITPAYAGKSFTAGKRFIDHEDHPRLCGEKERASEYIDMVTGSPPPMRGKVL